MFLFALLALFSVLTNSITVHSRSNTNTTPYDVIFLRNISSLTFYYDRYTTSKYHPAIKQLNCEGNACKYEKPDMIRCYNDGFDGVSVQWKCVAHTQDYYKLGRTRVSCENYKDFPVYFDSYNYGSLYYTTNLQDFTKQWIPVVKGSCGLHYEYTLTQKGRLFHQRKTQSPKPVKVNLIQSQNRYEYKDSYAQNKSKVTSWNVFLLFFNTLVIVFALTVCCCPNDLGRGTRRRPVPVVDHGFQNIGQPRYQRQYDVHMENSSPSSVSSFAAGVGVGFGVGSAYNNNQPVPPSFVTTTVPLTQTPQVVVNNQYTSSATSIPVVVKSRDDDNSDSYDDNESQTSSKMHETTSFGDTSLRG